MMITIMITTMMMMIPVIRVVITVAAMATVKPLKYKNSNIILSHVNISSIQKSTLNVNGTRYLH